MNVVHDLDRRLAAMLEDGPTRAPEAVVESALAHARTHPRRRDPLAALRRDPMGASGIRRPGFATLPLVAILGLLLAGTLAVAAVGGVFGDRDGIVPPPVSTATPTPSAEPTGTPGPSSAILPTVIEVDLVEDVGEDASVVVTDHSGTLVSAESGDPGDGASVEGGRLRIVSDPTDPATLVVTWSGLPCDTTHTLDIADIDRTITVTRPACEGDAIGVDHVVRLTFDSPVDPASISGSVVTTGD